MTLKAYVHTIDIKLKDTAKHVINSLSQQNFEIVNSSDLASCSYGIIFCEKVKPESCSQIQAICRNNKLQILVCCCGNTNYDVWQLMATGVTDVLAVPDLNISVSEIKARLERWEAVNSLLSSSVVQNHIIGESESLTTILRQSIEVAYFTDASVLIQGESGTGKEMLANLIHRLDNRPDKGELVILDCSTLMPELSGSEFFGHEKGAFTGAVSTRDGAFSLADGGTLFLDEIAELPLNMQAQLLRVIQEGTFKKVGSNQWQKSSFRLICATNLDLWKQVQRGVFRADLYYRIASYIGRLPPLRERSEDILPLAKHFLHKSFNKENKPIFDDTVVDYLLGREYPGNVRDLKQVVTRMLCRYAGEGPITVGCIPPEDRPVCTEGWQQPQNQDFEQVIRAALLRGMELKAISREAENTAIKIAVEETRGNLQHAAQRLGVTDRTLQLWRAGLRRVDS